MQFTQSKLMCIIYNDGVGIGNIQPRLNNSGGNKHIVLPIYKVHHYFFQLCTLHLTMTYRCFDFGEQTVNIRLYLKDVLHTVVDNEDLTSSFYFITYGFTNYIFVKSV